VINDGSKDNTAKVVETLTKIIPKITLINNERNHGKGWVTRQGITKAVGDIRLFMDADNSTKVDEVFKMIPYFGQGFDVVVGSRCIEGSNIIVNQSPIRIFLGWVLRTIIHILVPVGIADSQCGFKVFTEKASNIIFPKQTIFRWAFDVEILVIARKNKLKIKEVPITWINNTESHIKFSGMISMLLEIIKIRLSNYGEI
jgi:glycosyltransferase involved in cell wall biosynthesis